MKIVSITEINKQRSRISLDTEKSFVLYKGEIRMLHLKEGADLSEEDFLKIYKGILPKRCRMRAMNLLMDRRYTAYGLKKKLLDGGYPEEIADDAIDYVASFNYINDLEYAKDFINELQDQKSRKEIKNKLLTKGISLETIDDAFRVLGEERESYDEPSNEMLEIELIKKTLRKKNFTGSEDYESKQKLLAYFYRRGFNIEQVRRVMDDYLC